MPSIQDEIPFFNNGGHLGRRASLSDVILKNGHPRETHVLQIGSVILEK
jgi:hypothetical protein